MTIYITIGIFFFFHSSSSDDDEYEVKISFHNDLRYNITRGITMKAGLVFKESQLDWAGQDGAPDLLFFDEENRVLDSLAVCVSSL